MKYITIAALSGLLLAGGLISFQNIKLKNLRAANALLARNEAAHLLALSQAQLAADIAAEQARAAHKLNTDSAAALEQIRNLNLGECSNEEINADLADILGRRDVSTED